MLTTFFTSSNLFLIILILLNNIIKNNFNHIKRKKYYSSFLVSLILYTILYHFNLIPTLIYKFPFPFFDKRAPNLKQIDMLYIFFCICSQNIIFDFNFPGRITFVSLNTSFLGCTTSIWFSPTLHCSITTWLAGGEVTLFGIRLKPSRNCFESDLAVRLCICLGVSTI